MVADLLAEVLGLLLSDAELVGELADDDGRVRGEREGGRGWGRGQGRGRGPGRGHGCEWEWGGKEAPTRVFFSAGWGGKRGGRGRRETGSFFFLRFVVQEEIRGKYRHYNGHSMNIRVG